MTSVVDGSHFGSSHVKTNFNGSQSEVCVGRRSPTGSVEDDLKMSTPSICEVGETQFTVSRSESSQSPKTPEAWEGQFQHGTFLRATGISVSRRGFWGRRRDVPDFDGSFEGSSVPGSNHPSPTELHPRLSWKDPNNRWRPRDSPLEGSKKSWRRQRFC